uniref:Uncharacterized protein n=1 Tax=Arundo donax TaxID=35708 RepID=A0A0A9FP20_ARUDO
MHEPLYIADYRMQASAEMDICLWLLSR